MPVHYELDLPGRLVRVRIHGRITDAEILAADDALRADPDFEPDFDQLIDTSEASDGALSAGVLQEIAQRRPLFSRHSRRAIVVRTDLGYGLARVFQARRGEVAGEIQIFRSLAHAQHWLAEPRS